MNKPTRILSKRESTAYGIAGRGASVTKAIICLHVRRRLSNLNTSVYHCLRYLGVGLLLLSLTLGSTVAVSADAQPLSTTVATTSPTASDDTTSSATNTAAGSTSSLSDQSNSNVPTGVTQPTGPDAATYQYNASNGLWENEYYTWNPQTGQTTAKIAPLYTYNQQTGLWDTSLWQYQAATNDYALTPVSVSMPPAGAVTSGGPSDATTYSDDDLTTSPGSISPSDANPTNSNNNTVGIGNTIDSTAKSGDATVEDNSQAGNATSGTATAEATVLNELQSSSVPTAAGLSTFTQDISGNSQADLLIDPSQLPADVTETATSTTPLTVTNQQTGTISTAITLAATSGNATVASNQTAGNATSGAVSTDANVLNLDDSVVTASQSFLGIININGSYSGNIEVPTSSAGSFEAAYDMPSTPSGTNTDLSANTVNSDQDTNTAVNLSAATGSATEQDNGQSGTATSGIAQTKLTVLNLADQQMSGVDGLLVFVNVMGSWNGSIMNAPLGTTAAVLAMNPTSSAVTVPTATVSSAPFLSNTAIQTTINEHAQSGNATVEDNGQSGTAISGAATASATVINIVGSQFNLSNWFGILFINVFGSWTGNVATAPIASNVTPSGGTVAQSPSSVSSAPMLHSTLSSSRTILNSSLSTNPVQLSGTVDQTVTNPDNMIYARTRPQKIIASSHTGVSLPIVPIVLTLLALIAVTAEQLISLRRA